MSNNLALPPSAKSTLLRWVDAGAPAATVRTHWLSSLFAGFVSQWPEELARRCDRHAANRRSSSLGLRSTAIFCAGAQPDPMLVAGGGNLAVVPHRDHYLVWPGKIGNLEQRSGCFNLRRSLVEYVAGVRPLTGR